MDVKPHRRTDFLVRMFSRQASRTALLIAVALGVSLGPGCSTTRSSIVGGGNDANNAHLKGNYTYTLGGTMSGVTVGACSYCTNGIYQRAGTFLADGKGHITSGSDTFIQGSSPATNTVTGSYVVADDGTGLMMLSIGSSQVQLAFTIASGTNINWIEFDAFAGGAGGARLQDASAFGSFPSGTFIFRIHSYLSNTGAQGSVSSVGSMTITNGSINGSEDVVRAGSFSSPTVTGTLTMSDMSGAGSLTLTDSQGFTSDYLYHLIDAGTINLVETDLDAGQAQPRFGAGRAEHQSSTAFDDTALQGGFAFSSSGEVLSTLFSVVSVGAFNADGAGSITGGSYDSVVGGVPIPNAALTGNYSVQLNGRVTISLATQASGLPAIPEVAWMVNSSRAFFLVNLPGRAEDGTFSQQQNAPFSNSSLKGQFMLSMFGGDDQSPSQVDRVGVATFDGSSNLTVTDYFVNRGGARNQTGFTAVPYSVDPSGRVTASVNGLTNSLVMYLTSPQSGSLILKDPQTEISGTVTQQSSP